MKRNLHPAGKMAAIISNAGFISFSFNTFPFKAFHVKNHFKCLMIGNNNYLYLSSSFFYRYQ